MKKLILFFALFVFCFQNLIFSQNANDEPSGALFVDPMFINSTVCGDNTITFFVNDAFATNSTNMNGVPAPSCNNNSVNDVWVVFDPSSFSSNSFIVRRRSSTIATKVEAYTFVAGQGSYMPMPNTCADLEMPPNAIIIENANDSVYLRIWGGDGLGNGGQVELSIHNIDDINNWVICDDLTGENSGRIPNQLMVAYKPGVQPDGTLFGNLTPLKVCECGPRVIELWEFDNEVELETRRMQVATTEEAPVDTTGYNFNINDTVNIVPPTAYIGSKTNAPMTFVPNSPTKTVRVGIVDSGIDEAHDLFDDVLWINQEGATNTNCISGDEGQTGYDFRNATSPPVDSNGHGSWVSSVVLRDFPDTVQLELLTAKFHENGSGNLFDAICGMNYAVAEGVKVLNLSWGFWSNENPKILRDALNYAADQDVVVVCSAGNDNLANLDAGTNGLKLPAASTKSNIITVAAYHRVEGVNTFADYSNFGNVSVDLAAIGGATVPEIGSVDQLEDEGKYGTSIAAPQVARTAAIMRGIFPHLTATEVKGCILERVNLVQDWVDHDLMVTNGRLNHSPSLLCASLISDQRVKVKLKVLLEGAFKSESPSPEMNTTLFDNGLIPTHEPFGTGNNEFIPADFDESIDIVDWVNVTLFDTAGNSVASQAALLTTDGTIVNTNGSPLLIFEVPPSSPYSIRLETNNHLRVQTGSAVFLNN